MLKKFLLFATSSLSATAIDLSLFTVLCTVLAPIAPNFDVAIATVIARICSATYNCLVNYKIVFETEKSFGQALLRFAILATFIMSLSALFVTIGCELFPTLNPTFIKIVVDFCLFFVNYTCQKLIVFKD